MDWTLEDNLVGSLFFCTTVIGRRRDCTVTKDSLRRHYKGVGQLHITTLHSGASSPGLLNWMCKLQCVN